MLDAFMFVFLFASLCLCHSRRLHWFRWDCIHQLYIKVVGLGQFGGKHTFPRDRCYHEILPGTMWSATGLPLRPRPTLGISRRKSHTATSCWPHKQWPLSLADMVWPQLRLPCLANHKSSTFKQLEWWKIDETAAPRSANKNRTGQKAQLTQNVSKS